MAKVKGYYMYVDGIGAHVSMSNNKRPTKKTLEALAALIRAAHNSIKKEVSNG